MALCRNFCLLASIFSLLPSTSSLPWTDDHLILSIILAIPYPGHHHPHKALFTRAIMSLIILAAILFRCNAVIMTKKYYCWLVKFWSLIILVPYRVDPYEWFLILCLLVWLERVFHTSVGVCCCLFTCWITDTEMAMGVSSWFSSLLEWGGGGSYADKNKRPCSKVWNQACGLD